MKAMWTCCLKLTWATSLSSNVAFESLSQSVLAQGVRTYRLAAESPASAGVLVPAAVVSFGALDRGV